MRVVSVNKEFWAVAPALLYFGPCRWWAIKVWLCIRVDCRYYFYQDRGIPQGLCVVPLRFGRGGGILHSGELVRIDSGIFWEPDTSNCRYLGPEQSIAMATPNGAAADMVGAQPVIMTMEQFNQLGQLVANNHAENKNLQKLQHAARSIDRCDGLVPKHVRAWIRALDGWQSKVSDQCMMDLAKATSTGDLLEEIRARVNDSTDGGMHAINDWASLHAHVVEHFLSTCEDIKLQTQLESARQQMGESTRAYVHRFRADAARAYGMKARAATEETRVVASFLRSLADLQFAERLYWMGRVAKLDSAIKVALEKEAEREKMEQMLRSWGEEPMEVGALNATGQLLDLMGTI